MVQQYWTVNDWYRQLDIQNWNGRGHLRCNEKKTRTTLTFQNFQKIMNCSTIITRTYLESIKMNWKDSFSKNLRVWDQNVTVYYMSKRSTNWRKKSQQKVQKRTLKINIYAIDILCGYYIIMKRYTFNKTLWDLSSIASVHLTKNVFR